MLLVYIYVALACYNTGYMTLSVGNVENIVDMAADVAIVDARGIIIRRAKRGADGVEANAPSKGNAHGGLQELSDTQDLDWRNLWNTGTDAVLDVPIGGVCEVLYGSGRDLDDDD